MRLAPPPHTITPILFGQPFPRRPPPASLRSSAPGTALFLLLCCCVADGPPLEPHLPSPSPSAFAPPNLSRRLPRRSQEGGLATGLSQPNHSALRSFNSAPISPL